MKKILFAIIIILLMIVVYLIINKKNIETFITKFSDPDYNDTDIELPINDKYLPKLPDYDNNSFNKTNAEQSNIDYSIINLYKEILNRQPDADEFFKARKLTSEELKLQLLNTPEYNHSVNMQNNNGYANIEGAIAKQDLLLRIQVIYYKETGNDIHKKMILPIRDCFIHLQYNEYLLRAMINNSNYDKFQNDVLKTKGLNNDKLIKLFNKHFDLLELKMKANDIIKYDLINQENSDVEVDTFEINTNNSSSVNIKDNETFTSITDSIDTNSNKIFNKDVIAEKLDNNKPVPTPSKKELFESKDNDTIRYKKVYNPIHYQQEYRGPPEFKPNVCNTLNQKRLVKPVFTESKLLFQGTSLEEAYQNTQMGSIMPRFEYKEYEFVPI